MKSFAGSELIDDVVGEGEDRAASFHLEGELWRQGRLAVKRAQDVAAAPRVATICESPDGVTQAPDRSSGGRPSIQPGSESV